MKAICTILLFFFCTFAASFTNASSISVVFLQNTALINKKTVVTQTVDTLKNKEPKKKPVKYSTKIEPMISPGLVEKIPALKPFIVGVEKIIGGLINIFKN